MYSNNILNFHEFSTILNAWTKKVWKLIKGITYNGRHISSIESDFSLPVTISWNAFDRLLINVKYNLSIRWNITRFLPRCVRTAICMHHVAVNKTHHEKSREELQKNAACRLEQILEATIYKITIVRTPASYLPNHPSTTNKTWCGLLEKQGRIYKRRSPMDSCTWTCLCWTTSKTYISSLRT